MGKVTQLPFNTGRSFRSFLIHNNQSKHETCILRNKNNISREKKCVSQRENSSAHNEKYSLLYEKYAPPSNENALHVENENALHVEKTTFTHAYTVWLPLFRNIQSSGDMKKFRFSSQKPFYCCVKPPFYCYVKPPGDNITILHDHITSYFRKV